MLAERPLNLNRGLHRVAETAERDEEGIALRIDLRAAVLRKRGAKKSSMLGEHWAVKRRVTVPLGKSAIPPASWQANDVYAWSRTGPLVELPRVLANLPG